MVVAGVSMTSWPSCLFHSLPSPLEWLVCFISHQHNTSNRYCKQMYHHNGKLGMDTTMELTMLLYGRQILLDFRMASVLCLGLRCRPCCVTEYMWWKSQRSRLLFDQTYLLRLGCKIYHSAFKFGHHFGVLTNSIVHPSLKSRVGLVEET